MNDSSSYTTLVVDDNDTKRYIIGSWLRRAGHTVVEAASAAQVWVRLAEHEVDLVVLDIQLPDVNGMEVCEQIKGSPATASLPVIHISATAVDVADRTDGLQRGADAYMTDPIDPGEFIATAEAVLRYYRARRRAERMADRMAAFTRTSLAVNAAETFDALAVIAARGAFEIFGEPAAVFLLPPDGRMRRTVAAGGVPRSLPCPTGMPARLAELTGLGEDTGTRVAPVSARQWAELLPDAVVGDDVLLVTSRIKPDRPPIGVAIGARGAADEDDANLLRQLGQTLVLAMEALRSYTVEHLISLTLQRSLLPAARPVVPGWTFAVRYEPASDQAEVGGDFYEVIDRGHEVLIAIGDVQGHSLHAATVMAELRHALRAFAEEGHDAVAILGLLNDVLQRYHNDQTATMCLMTLDPRTGALRVANAGHPPPLHVAGGRGEYGGRGGLLLGFPVSHVGSEELTVPPGGAVVLITDGLVEERGVPLGDNLDRLRTVAAQMDDDLEKFSDRIIAEFGPREDDVALIVMRRDLA
ncbi:SpoIIE family protein phosphatase [Actinomadura syzygii]|uniref:Fused response regulator/phosphatase n=1 Tax=Actinomadura syzygii TaxID=1427538 RepID=A0A5D0TWP0_9ACTN|nr:fused response regulator/phosphatase [Actinomadura syzygii]TYC09762.1 fused response regulator/phosphatase [Actinomadura syzygii]